MRALTVLSKNKKVIRVPPAKALTQMCLINYSRGMLQGLEGIVRIWHLCFSRTNVDASGLAFGWGK